MNRKQLFLSVSFLFVFAAAAFAAAPSVFFSDLTSGPNRGGKNDQGVFVTVAGKNFGATQGGSYVTVGGAKAAEYLVWSDTKISFQVGQQAATGQIQVVTSGGASNTVPFTVRPGNIYFVDDTSPNSPGSGTFNDPWRSPASFYGAARAGDTCYFRAGTYSGTYAESGANFNFGAGAAQGGPNNEIAYAGYPGETATFSGYRNFVFGYSKSYYVIAGLNLSASGKTVGLDGDHLRVVNNRCEGLKVQDYANIHPVIGGPFLIYGNEIFGATSADKHDHPIYVDNGSDNVDIGWNYFHDNNVDQGPVISVNTDYAVTQHFKFENIRVHDNLMDCSGARGIGIVATDYGSTVYVYNNVMTNVSGSAIYQYSASSWIYNNLFFNVSGGPVVSLGTVLDAGNDYHPEIVEIKNNVFYGSAPYFSVSNESAMTAVTLGNNCYSGGGSGPSRDGAALNADPLFVSAASGDFRLVSNSPCVDRGVGIPSVVAFDKDGVLRPQGAAADIGPYEYFRGGTTAGTGGGTGTGTGTGTTTGTGSTGSSTGTTTTTTTTAADTGTTGHIQDPAVTGGTGTGVGTPPVATPGLAVRAGEIRVVGSKDGRGTVNPDRGEKASIAFKGGAAGRFECRICTLSGDQVWKSEQDGADAGTFEWFPKDMASGVYIAHIKGPGLNAKKKIVILR